MAEWYARQDDYSAQEASGGNGSSVTRTAVWALCSPGWRDPWGSVRWEGQLRTPDKAAGRQ